MLLGSSGNRATTEVPRGCLPLPGNPEMQQRIAIPGYNWPGWFAVHFIIQGPTENTVAVLCALDEQLDNSLSPKSYYSTKEKKLNDMYR